jgi:hypothetical protein
MNAMRSRRFLTEVELTDFVNNYQGGSINTIAITFDTSSGSFVLFYSVTPA